MTMLSWAMYYREQGYFILPVEGKNPAVKYAHRRDEFPTAAEVEGWWRRWPNANIAAVTGTESDLVVVDTDGAEAEAWATAQGLTSDVVVRTGRDGGGFHRWYRAPNGLILRKTRIYSTSDGGVDIQAEGGIVVLPPSLHHSGRRYQFIAGAPDMTLPELPGWVIAAAGARHSSTKEVDEFHVGASLEVETPQGVAKMRAALQCLDPDMAYDQWFRVVAAVLNHQWSVCEDIAEDWTRSAKREHTRLNTDLPTKFATIRKEGRGIGPGTLYFMAQAQGFNPCAMAASPPPLSTAVEVPAAAKEAPSERIPESAEGFRHSSTGLLQAYLQDKDSDEGKWETLYHRPIYLAAVRRTEHYPHNTFYVFRQLVDGVWEDVQLPARDVRSTQVLAILAGAAISLYPEHIKPFQRYVIAEVARRRMEKMYQQFGWKDDGSFLSGQWLYHPSGDKSRAPLAEDVAARARNMTVEGTLEGWKNAVRPFFAEGMEWQSITILAAFAAPLMKFNPNNGGAVLALRSPKTAKGKTTTMTVAASVYGSLSALQVTSNDSHTSMFNVVSRLCNLPVFNDEIRVRDPEGVRHLLETFTTGVDKNRTRRDGSLQDTKNPWQTILITGANDSLYEILVTANGMSAQAARVVELNVGALPGGDEKYGERLMKAALSNRGHAGDLYLSTILRPDVHDGLPAALEVARDVFGAALGEDDARRANRYRTWLMASLVVAAGICVRLGLIEVSVDRLSQWMINNLRDASTLDTSLYADADIHNAAGHVSAFLNAHTGNRLVVGNRWTSRHTVADVRREPLAGKPLLIRQELADNRIYIDQPALKGWLTAKGINFTDTMKLLSGGRAGWSNRKKNLGAGTQLTAGQVYVVEIDTSHEVFAGHLRLVEDAPAQGVA